MARRGLIIIFILALFLRGWQILSHPISLSLDEVAYGVAAEWTANTGHDEYGNFMPLAFYSVGDYKPPVGIYLISLFVKFFGLSKLTVRLPVVLIGALTSVVAVLLLKKLKLLSVTSYFGGLVIALSAWHIHFSRGSFEAVIALFFALSGSLFFINWSEKRCSLYAILTAASFGLSVWSYHSSRIFVPLFVISLFVIYRKSFVTKYKKDITDFILTTLIFAIPFLYLAIFTPAIAERAASTSIMREQSLIQNLRNGEYSSFFEFVLNNDFLIIAQHWSQKYLNYFDFNFWFLRGIYFAPPGYPDLGLLYLVNIPLLLVGFYALAISKESKTKYFFLAWFLLGPLAASFTMNEQHSLRSLIWIFAFVILIARGFEYLFDKLGWKFLLPYLVLLIVNLLYAKTMYTKSFPYFYADTWQYGYEEIAQFACENKDNYNKIFVSESFGERGHFTSIPQYYLAFYCGGKPSDYVTKLALEAPEGIYLKRPLWNVDQDNFPNSLFIASPRDFGAEADTLKVIKEIDYPSGEVAFWFVETE